MSNDEHNMNMNTMSYVFRTPRGKSTVASVPTSATYDLFLRALVERAVETDQDHVNLQLSRLSLGNSRKSPCTSQHGHGQGRLVRRRTGVDRFIENRSDYDQKTAARSAAIGMHRNGNCSDTTCTDNDCTMKPVNFSSLAFVVLGGKVLGRKEYGNLTAKHSKTYSPGTIHHISLRVRLRGGVDRQNRVGSKFGGGGQSSGQQSERERKERLRQLALETVDLAKDPYLMRNHLGTYECKLCLTLHTNEGNYLAHTQGKKHQAGLAKRAAMEAKLKGKTNVGPVCPAATTTLNIQRVKIGRPGYEITKSRHHKTNQRCLSFQLHFPEIDSNVQPRHRFMSAFEQRVESPPDRRFQYLLIAADPYETVAFKIPNEKIERSEGMFVTNWDSTERKFTLTLYFVDDKNGPKA